MFKNRLRAAHKDTHKFRLKSVFQKMTPARHGISKSFLYSYDVENKKSEHLKQNQERE